MKRFTFPLERVRKWRGDQSDLEEMRLQQLYTEFRALQDEQKRIAEEADRSRRAVIAQSFVTSEELSTMDAFTEYAQQQVRRLAARQQATGIRIIEQKAKLLEAHRRFQLLDGLRDKALVGWTAGRDKEQEDLAAELFLARKNRE